MSGHHPQSSVPPRYNALQLTQSTFGIPIPLVYGQTRVPAFLLQYEDFTVTTHTDSGGGGKGGGSNAGTTSNSYSAAVVLGICEGPIGGIFSVYNDKAKNALSDLGLTFFTGAGGQAPWSYLTTNHPTRALGYDHTAYVANGSLPLGGSAALPNYTFETRALLPYNPAVTYDAEPSAIWTDYLTDPVHGADFPYLGDLTQFTNYCVAMAIFLSPAELTQRKATDFLNESLQATNCEAIWSQGLLKVIPYGDETVVGANGTFVPNLTPLFSFTDDDYIVSSEGADPIISERRPPEEIYNTLRVEFMDRANQYNLALAEATIDLDVIANGKRPMQNISLNQITTGTVARLVAQLILNRQFYIRNTYTFTVRADYCQLEGMDVVEINDATLGLSHKLIRLTRVEHGAPPNRYVKLIGEELPLGPGGSPVYNWELSQGYSANYGIAPGVVQTPLMIMAPPTLVAVQGGYELWIAIAGVDQVNWGGCNIYGSLDNLNYEYIGTINGSAKYGVLTTSLATSATQLDTTHTLQVQLNDTSLSIPGSSSADADNFRSLLYVDGEIMAYGNSTLAGAGIYNLSYLRRGLYGSPISAHSAGTQFARLDTGIFRMKIDPGFIGQTMYLKFPSFNSYLRNAQPLSSTTAYAKSLAVNSMGSTLPATGATLFGRGVVIVGDTAFKYPGGASGWDSDLYSIEGYGAGSRISWKAGNNGQFMMGLSSNPTLDQTYTSINFSFRLTSVGTWEIWELGTQVAGPGGSYVVGVDTFLITHDGANVTYFVNGVQKRQVPYTATTLFADSSFFTPGAMAKNIKFGPNAQVANIGTGQIAGSAVTSLTSSYVTGPLTRTSAANAQLLMSTSLSLPQASDTSQSWIITATLESMSSEATDYGGAIQFQLYCDTHDSFGPTDSFQFGNVVNASNSRKPMTLQAIFTALGPSPTKSQSVGIAVNFTTGVSITATAWQIQYHAELIKR